MPLRRRAKKLRPVNTIAKAIDKANRGMAEIQDALDAHTPFYVFTNAVRRLVKLRGELEKIDDSPFSYAAPPNLEHRLARAQTYLDLFDFYSKASDFHGLYVDPTDQVQKAEQDYASVIEDWESGKLKKGLLEYVFSPGDKTPDLVKFHSSNILRVRAYAAVALPLIHAHRPDNHCVSRFVSENSASIEQIGALKAKIYSLEKELESARHFERQHGNTLAITARAKSQTRSRVSDLQHLVQRTSDCPYCGEPLGGTPHLDHIHPVSCGGLSVLENLVWACQRCNGLKSNKTVLEFCEQSSLDLSTVIHRLRSQGKRV